MLKTLNNVGSKTLCNVCLSTLNNSSFLLYYTSRLFINDPWHLDVTIGAKYNPVGRDLSIGLGTYRFSVSFMGSAQCMIHYNIYIWYSFHTPWHCILWFRGRWFPCRIDFREHGYITKNIVRVKISYISKNSSQRLL